MPDEAPSETARSLPVRPSLRHLKIEAKRRLAAGEFATLHDAQAAIAREHAVPGWAALKQACTQISGAEDGPALAHVRWIADRFRDAGGPGWTAPGEDELRQHFDDRFLAAIPADRLAETIAANAADLRAELTVIRQVPFEAQVQLSGLRYVAIATPGPPHRLIGLRGFPLAERITDPRVKAPPPVRAACRRRTSSASSRPGPAPNWACPPCSWPAASPGSPRGRSPPATLISAGPRSAWPGPWNRCPWSPAICSRCPA